MKEIIDAFFRSKGVVNHQIESMNYFVSTKDNPNSIMQQIVDETKISDEDEAGIILLDKSKTNGKEIRIVYGRTKDRNGKLSGPTIWVEKPEIKEASGAANQITPNEARLRDLNYLAPINLKVKIIEDGVERDSETIRIGELPVMVRSKICTLSGPSLDQYIEKNNGPVSGTREEKLQYVGEDPSDPGGYFIIGGSERAIVSLEDLAPNRILVESEEKYESMVEVAKVFSQRGGFRALTSMEKGNDGIINVTIPSVAGTIPLAILIEMPRGISHQGDLQTILFSYLQDGPCRPLFSFPRQVQEGLLPFFQGKLPSCIFPPRNRQDAAAVTYPASERSSSPCIPSPVLMQTSFRGKLSNPQCC